MTDDAHADDNRSRVVFLNEFDEEVPAQKIRQEIAQRFKLGAKALDRLFAGRPIVVKRDVDAETALHYKLAIEKTGARCKIEIMPEVDDTDRHGYVERRKHERRQAPDRRDRTRTEAIKPDRREDDRRKGGPTNGDH